MWYRHCGVSSDPIIAHTAGPQGPVSVCVSMSVEVNGVASCWEFDGVCVVCCVCYFRGDSVMSLSNFLCREICIIRTILLHNTF